MKRFFRAIGRFFLPPASAKTFIRLLPLFVIAFIVVILFVVANYAWERSNSPVFCGTTCHTMPPEYVTYSNSPHTNIACEDCHMGRDTLGIMIERKARYSWQTGSAMVLNTYHYPIYAKNMAPAREACENCHKPEKFSNDKLIEYKHYATDETNTPSSTYLVMHTGGGTSRQGLGYGIHWHIENPVQYYATDQQQQDIPYIVVTNPDGTKTEYTDIGANFDASKIQAGQLKTMDCITCHNRTAHLATSPEAEMDSLLTRGLVSSKIPNIKAKGVEVLSAKYTSEKEAMDAISGLANYYKTEQSSFYTSENSAGLVDAALKNMQNSWKDNNFLDQKFDWSTHADNLQHKDSPGCFRCHDGKHLTKANEAIRLECNLCHSVPSISSPSQLTANVQISKGAEPTTHKNPNWITLHNTVFDQTCQGCHSVDDAGGTSNTSFCSNSVCHGATWKFAGFNAPQLRVALAEQAKAMIPTATATPEVTPTLEPTATKEPTATPTLEEGASESGSSASGSDSTTPTPTATPTGSASTGGTGSKVTYATLLPILTDKCGTCHGAAAMKGLNVTTYATLMKGGDSGPVVKPGSPDTSKIVEVQKAGGHPGQLDAKGLQTLIDWIKGGALEK
jgi:nitrate/TMAO reductase-like tetraheme cytochrome c subunit